MNVSQTISNLFEDEFGIWFLQLSFSFDESEQITSSSVLHHHQKMFAGLEYFKKSDNVGMFYLFKKINLLENFPFAKIILHIILFNCFDSHLLARKFMNTKSNFSKSTFSNKLDKLIKVQSCWW